MHGGENLIYPQTSPHDQPSCPHLVENYSLHCIFSKTLNTYHRGRRPVIIALGTSLCCYGMVISFVPEISFLAFLFVIYYTDLKQASDNGSSLARYVCQTEVT